MSGDKLWTGRVDDHESSTHLIARTSAATGASNISLTPNHLL